MRIIEEKYSWAAQLQRRKATTHLILHHAAASGLSAQDIHRFHLGKGWAGIAYHYYVRKDGNIYTGRPENAVGGHTSGMNWCSIGVCFEGNFETDEMSREQKAAGLALAANIRARYPDIEIGGHREYGATACPGKNFPLEEMKNVDVRDAVPAWARDEFQEAVSLGITDGTGPLASVPRYQAAIMSLRAAKALGGDAAKTKTKGKGAKK